MPFEQVGDVSYDTTAWGDISESIKTRLGCIGTVGASNHNSAHHFWKSSQGGLAQALASNMGGNAAIKAARVGSVIGASDGTDVGGVALEPVSSLESALATLNGVTHLSSIPYLLAAAVVASMIAERSAAPFSFPAFAFAALAIRSVACLH